MEPSSPESDEVLAYWKTVPEKGGPVLMLDRRLRRMTAEEFKAARLAGTEEQKSPKSRINRERQERHADRFIWRSGRVGFRIDRAAICDRRAAAPSASAIFSANEPISGSSIAT